MATTIYAKHPKTYADQLQLLKDRGLIIESDEKAIHLLHKLSYYRLSGYWYPLLKDPKSDHVFKEKATFQQAFGLYRFDRDLRIFILKELEKIEVAVRAEMIYILSHSKGTFWYTDPSHFFDAAKHTRSIQKLTYEFSRSDEDFITSFKNNYSNPLPPSWMMLEISSFGNISTLYKNLKPGRSKRDIAHHFGLDDTTFMSWLHCLVYIRNVCAHHSRLWNRTLTVKPQLPINPINKWLTNSHVSNDKTYIVLSMLLYLLQSVDIKNQLIYRLMVLLKKYPNVDIAAMGFPSNWKTEPLWEYKPSLKQRLRLLITSREI